jgi:RNA polymerase sigma-70 factor, ECF subfamily
MESPVAVDALRADIKLEGDALLADYVQRYRSLVERLCRILLRDSTDAEDAAQQTFLLAYQSLLSGTRPHHPRAWLCTIARRECWARDYRRRRESAVPREEARAEPDPAERTVLRAELATINAGLEQLPARQRQAIVLRELAGLSYTQLAAALEVSESAAEALLVRARRNLREVRLVLFLIPFPRSLKRLFQHGSRHAGSGVGVSAAKAVAVATIVTATVAVAGSAAPAERAVEPAPIVAKRMIPRAKPAARTPHRAAPARRPAVRRRPQVVPQIPARSTKRTVAPARVEVAALATATQSVTSDSGSSAAPSPSTAPRPAVRPSPPAAKPRDPQPSGPRPPATPPKHPNASPAPPTPTTPAPAPPPPTATGPTTTPPPPPTDTTGTTPAAPDGPSGTGSATDGETRPGNGYGDTHHDHTGKK